MSWVVASIVGYLCGSIPFAYLLTRAATGEDLRGTGSGNLGATNVLRRTGWGLGLATLALDVGKGAVSVWLGGWLGAQAAPPPDSAAVFGPDVLLLPAVIAGAAAVVGHVYPVWLGFAGGKGVATAAGVFAVLAPAVTLGAVIAFLVIVWRTRYVSLGSITGTVLVPVLTVIGEAPRPVWMAACGVCALVLFKHRENLARLWRGRERRLGERVGAAAPAGGADSTGGHDGGRP